MALLAIKDILLRSNVYASGAINISFMALAGFSLYLFANRLLGQAAAVALAVLFIVQYPGLEMVTYGHISPYLLALAFFGFAMTELLKIDIRSHPRLIWAGVFLLVGSLVHEIIIVSLLLTAAALMIVNWRQAGRATIKGIPLSSYIIKALIPPILVYLGLNLVDFLYHGAPLPESPLFNGFPGLPLILAAPGAAAVAFAAPFNVELVPDLLRTLVWDFGDIMPIIIGTGIAVSFLLAVGIYMSIHALMKGSSSPLTLTTLMILFMFMGFIIGVGYGRLYLGDITYMYIATYYYSITGYIFCMLLATGAHWLSKIWCTSKSKHYASGAVLVISFALIGINYSMTMTTLKRVGISWSDTAERQLILDEALPENKDEYCLAGFLPSSSIFSTGSHSILMRNYFCRSSDNRAPVYVAAKINGSLQLKQLEKQPSNYEENANLVQLGEGGAAYENLKAALNIKNLGDEIMVYLSRDTHDTPDLSVTLKHSLNAAIIVGHHDTNNYIAFRVMGPIVRIELVNDGESERLPYRACLPFIEPEYRIEMRHADPYVYFFINDNLMTFMPSRLEQAGKVGIVLQKNNQNETTFSDFVVVPSKESTPLAFTPLAKISGEL
jgi:hypothetical protein